MYEIQEIVLIYIYSCVKLVINTEKNKKKDEVIHMAKPKGWEDTTPLNEKGFLTMKEAAKYTGIGYQLTKQLILSGEFPDIITVGKQNRVLVDKNSYMEFLKQKGHVELKDD